MHACADLGVERYMRTLAWALSDACVQCVGRCAIHVCDTCVRSLCMAKHCQTQVRVTTHDTHEDLNLKSRFQIDISRVIGTDLTYD